MLSARSSHKRPSVAPDERIARYGCCRRSSLRLFIFTIFLLGYLCIGTVCFMWIEQPHELKERALFNKHRMQFRKAFNCVSDAAFEDLITRVIKASNLGLHFIKNDSDVDNWSFGTSFFFSTTLVTTVGYGRTAPLSEGGKLFCIFFAMIGIPLTLIFFTAIIERLSVPSEMLHVYMRRVFPETMSDFHVRVVHLNVVVMLHLVVLTLIPAAIFDYIEEDWTFLDSFYFCFITWTTVGLGDFVPGEGRYHEWHVVYKMMASGYMFASLISMLFVLKIFHETPHVDLGVHICMVSDIRGSEELPLNPGNRGPKYMRQQDETSSNADGVNDIKRFF